MSIDVPHAARHTPDLASFRRISVGDRRLVMMTPLAKAFGFLAHISVDGILQFRATDEQASSLALAYTKTEKMLSVERGSQRNT